MGGASASAAPAASAMSAVPAASSAGGYASQGAMSAATIKGTTGSNISGMGWVPRAQMDYSKIFDAFGGALKDSSGQFGKAVAGQQYGLGGQSASSPFSPQGPFPFAGLTREMPRVQSRGFRLASASAGPLQQTGMGYSI